jgi:hypothetical protein
MTRRSQTPPVDRRANRRLTDRLADRMNKEWSAKYPDAPIEFVAYSRQLFREVYYRARLWRRHEPEAELSEEAAALHRILRQVEFELGAKPQGRPASVIGILLGDLQATIWSRPDSQRAADENGPLAVDDLVGVGDAARTSEPV